MNNLIRIYLLDGIAAWATLDNKKDNSWFEMQHHILGTCRTGLQPLSLSSQPQKNVTLFQVYLLWPEKSKFTAVPLDSLHEKDCTQERISIKTN